MILSDQQVLEIFSELPSHRGCSSEELNAVEQQFGIKLPQQYRTMMQLDAERLVAAEIVLSLNSLRKYRDEASHILINHGRSFRLAATDFVFAWDEVYAFYFFSANGEPDSPVKKFNYYSSEDNWEPTIACATLAKYFAEMIRHYLKL